MNNIIFNEDISLVFTDEKFYAIYQDFIKMKIDTEGFLWWFKGKKNNNRRTEESIRFC